MMPLYRRWRWSTSCVPGLYSQQVCALYVLYCIIIVGVPGLYSQQVCALYVLYCIIIVGVPGLYSQQVCALYVLYCIIIVDTNISNSSSED